MIQPTVGRVVNYFVFVSNYEFGFSVRGGKPHAAIVTCVHGDRMVNLSVFDANGRQFPKTSVRLLQPGDDKDDVFDDWCEWPPFQTSQVQKTEPAVEIDR